MKKKTNNTVYAVAYLDELGNGYKEIYPYIHYGVVDSKSRNLDFANYIVNELNYKKAVVFKSTEEELSKQEQITWEFVNKRKIKEYKQI